MTHEKEGKDMAFRFSLGAVLQVRESVERREERALQRIQLEIARVTLQVEEADKVVANVREERDKALRVPTAAAHLTAMVEEEEAAVVARKALAEALEELAVKRGEQMRRYHAAHRDHEALVNMRNERLAAYEQQQARSEQKTLDDIFIARRNRG